MSDQITIREAVAQDVPAIAGLVRSIYDVKRTDDYHAWRLFNNVVPSVMMLAFGTGQLVGTSSVFKGRLTCGARCGHLSYLNIRDGFRGKGLLTRLSNKAMDHFDDLDLLYVFANPSAVSPCEKGLGFIMIGTVGTMTLDARSIDGPNTNRTACRVVDTATIFDSIGGYPAMFEHTQAYRTWRYAANPLYKYFKMSLETGEFAVCKEFTDPVSMTRYGDIVDLSCDLADTTTLIDLVRGACLHLKDLGAQKITFWALPRAICDAAKEVGFTKGSYKKHFGLKVLNRQYDHLYDFSLWHLQQVDATNY